MATVNMIAPQPQTSSTAVAGKTDALDRAVYSAVVVAQGAQGELVAFSNSTGQPIQSRLPSGLPATALPAFMQTHSDATTNLTEPSRPGASLGELGVRAIGVNIQASFQPSTSYPGGATPTIPTTPGAYGSTADDLLEITGKMSLEFKISNKQYDIGPLWSYPAIGGVSGSAAASQYGQNPATANVYSLAQNTLGQRRNYIAPIQIARNDNIKALLKVAAGDTLLLGLNTQYHYQPTLLTVVMMCNAFGDLR